MNEKLKDVITRLRKRLVDYRVYKQDKEISIHINSIEIALCLTEFSVKTNPHRPISRDEERWFTGGYYVDMVLRDSEWEDIADLYNALVKEVEKEQYFR